MAQKIKLSVITIFVFILCNIQNVYANDEYYIGLEYYSRYNLTGSSQFTDLGRYYIESEPYLDSWNIKKTWTIDTSSSVGIYSTVNKYNSDTYTFSIEPKIESNNTGSSINTFKLYNMHIFFYYKPQHILTEGNIKGSFINFLPVELMKTAKIHLQGRLRTTGEWVTLKEYWLQNTESVISLEWQSNDENPSFNFSEYRLNVLYSDFYNNGLTLIANGSAASEQKICSFDFVGVETNDYEKKLDELIDSQNSLFSKLGDITKDISNLGDLITSIPDLILDGLFELFVPNDLKGKFNDFIDELLDDMGILGFPFEFAKMELEEISNYNAISIINVPDIEFMGETWLKNYKFDFAIIGNIKLLGFNNFTLIYLVRMITTYLLAMALIYRVKTLLYDFGILNNPNDDIGGDI